MLQVYNETRNRFLVTQGRIADTFWRRGKGLIGTKQLDEGDGLLIDPCNSIHCFFMSIPIDVLYLDADNQVVGLDEQMRPWRIGKPRRGARRVLEMPVGQIQRTATQIGDRLSLDYLET